MIHITQTRVRLDDATFTAWGSPPKVDVHISENSVYLTPLGAANVIAEGGDWVIKCVIPYADRTSYRAQFRNIYGLKCLFIPHALVVYIGNDTNLTGHYGRTKSRAVGSRQ